MVSGGSQANLIAMMMARHQAMPDIKAKGLTGQTLVAFVSDQAHYSAQKAANLLGIGTDNLIAVASDAQGRLCPQALAIAIETSLEQGHLPFFIGLTAGTTVLGAFDPVMECRAIANQHGMWLHIDGAWGAPVLFSQHHRHLLNGSDLADSFAWDAHKLMNVPITAAVILTRHQGLLELACGGGGGDLINGGFFVLSPKCLELIQGDQSSWEGEPLTNLAKNNEMMSFEHQGFWQPMDTLRDKNFLEDLWTSGKAPWKVW